MRDLLIATTNPDKLKEVRRVLADTSVRVISLDELPAVAHPDETGATFAENARIKAVYYSLHSARAEGRDGTSRHMLTVAEDSGLVVDALDGEPGVRSARFIRPDASYPERFEEIFRRLAQHPARPRTARFVAALAVAASGRVVFEATGVVEGEITRAAKGTAGFGYDPIFLYPPYGRTLAEATEEEKLRVAHRGKAFRALARWLLSTEIMRRGD
jgi:XTP/dITP diphosphohydrolase